MILCRRDDDLDNNLITVILEGENKTHISLSPVLSQDIMNLCAVFWCFIIFQYHGSITLL